MNVVYPGSFDPVTNGHLDIIERCSKKFTKVIVAVLNNSTKNCMFTIEERTQLLKKTTAHLKNVEIDSFSGLLSEYAVQKNCSTMVRGLRAVSDYEYEMQMALVNKKLNENLETLFMVSSSEFVYLSSSIVKEISMLGGDIGWFVPEAVEKALQAKIKGGI
jgi:pantetheine-phosphate adenylyltransferase